MATKTRKRAPFKTHDPMLTREKETYAKFITDTINNAGMTQMEAATVMKDAPSQISLVMSGKLKGFSTDRLKLMATRLGANISVTLSHGSGKTGKLTITVAK